jgi:hypothetical protein
VSDTGPTPDIIDCDIRAGAWISSMSVGAVFDPETIELLRASLDDAWAKLTPRQQAVTSKSALAARILEAAAEGERDPAMLQLRASLAVGADIPVVTESDKKN